MLDSFDVDLRFWKNTYPVCPYCNHQDTEIWDCRSLDHDEDQTVLTCERCDRDYQCMIHIEYTYTTGELNDDT